jgi:hypothetical protein
MINHARRGSAGTSPKSAASTLDAAPQAPHGAEMNGFLAICGICREIIR